MTKVAEVSARALTRKAAVVIAILLAAIASVAVLAWEMPRLNDQIVAGD